MPGMVERANNPRSLTQNMLLGSKIYADSDGNLMCLMVFLCGLPVRRIVLVAECDRRHAGVFFEKAAQIG